MMRALRLPLMIATIGAMLVAGLIGGLAVTLQTDNVPDRGGVYIEGVVGSPLSINPVLASFNEVDRDLSTLLFSGLMRLNERAEPVPDLAAGWSLSPDGKTVTVPLRRDAYWHDGAPFGALDVVYTVKAIQDPKFQGAPDLAETWKGVTVEPLDDYTVRFRLRDSFSPFLTNLAVGMLPAHILRDVPAEALPDHPFRSSPIGTGPYSLKDTTADYVTLTSNDGYYGTKPYLKTVRVRFFQQRSQLLAALKAREIQGAVGVTATEIERLGKGKDYEVYTAPRASFTVLFLNNRSPFFRDKAVRQAFAYGIDRQKIVDVAVGGLGIIANSPMPPGTWAADIELPRYQVDLEKARGLLDGAGWGPGADGIRERDGQKFRISLLTNDDPQRVRAAEEVAKQLARLGIQAVVSASGYSGLIERFLAPRTFDTLLFGLDPGGDPDGYSNWHSSQAKSGGFNFISYNNRRVDEVLEQARASNDPIQRAALYREFQAIFADDVPSLLLYYPLATYAIDRGVRGVSLTLLFDTSDRFRTMNSWYVKTKRVMTFGTPTV